MMAGSGVAGMQSVGWIPVATTVVRMVKGELARGLWSNSGGGKDVLQFAGADYCIDFGNVLLDLVAVALDEASGNDELLSLAAGLKTGHLEDGIDRLLFGRIDEGAGVDDQHVGGFGIADDARAGVVEQAHHDFAVDEVLGAAEADESHPERGRGGFRFAGGAVWRGWRLFERDFFHTLYFTGCQRYSRLRATYFQGAELLRK